MFLAAMEPRNIRGLGTGLGQTEIRSLAQASDKE